MQVNNYKNANRYCTPDCPGCPNCLSMSSSKSGGKGSYYYSKTETVIMKGGSPDEIEDLKDRASQLSIASSSRSRNSCRKPASTVNGWLESVGEDEAVRFHHPNQFLLPSPTLPGPRSTMSRRSSSTHRPNRDRSFDNDDARTVMTVNTITPSESASVASRSTRTTRRASHSGRPDTSSQVSSLHRSMLDAPAYYDDDISTIRGPYTKGPNHTISSRRSSASRAPTRAPCAPRHVSSDRRGPRSEISHRGGPHAHRGPSEVGSMATRHHRDDTRSAISRGPSMIGSRHGHASAIHGSAYPRANSVVHNMGPSPGHRGSRDPRNHKM